ncbi:MAG TPA: sensor histidine kinase [Pseudonocardiaceae bacterium]|jgi:signal transduction histidine kinase|nr:sensor histidine kinase [Pseudonocardiaceae bacterium]
MSGPEAHGWLDGQRWSPLVTVVPYALLGALTVVTVVLEHSAGYPLLVDLILCGLAAGWMLVLFTLNPAWRDRPAVMGVFLAGLLVVMFFLVTRDPWFGFFAPAGYFYAFRLLPWPLVLPGVAAVAVVAGTAQAYGVPKADVAGVLAYLAVLAVNVLPMCLFAWLSWRNETHNKQRDQALAEAREANRRLAATLAENAGLHEQLLTQAREAGVFDERQRMAREIHDTLAQGLTGIITQLQATEEVGADPEGWRQRVDLATRLARESLTEARRSVDALRPEPLDTGRLGEALAGVAERWSALYGVPVQVTTTGTTRPMPPEAEVALLRAAQEALANVAKHAHASRVGVTLSYLEHEIALDVRDDGQGFESVQLADGPEPAFAGPNGSNEMADNGFSGGADAGRRQSRAGGPPTDGGFGLIAMRQRIEGLSGTLSVESEPGVGTAVSARVPGGPEADA